MRQILLRDRPTIICEILQGRVDTTAIESELRPLGYKYFLLRPDGPEPRQVIDGHPEFLNFLFTVDPGRDLAEPPSP